MCLASRMQTCFFHSIIPMPHRVIIVFLEPDSGYTSTCNRYATLSLSLFIIIACLITFFVLFYFLFHLSSSSSSFSSCDNCCSCLSIIDTLKGRIFLLPSVYFSCWLITTCSSDLSVWNSAYDFISWVPERLLLFIVSHCFVTKSRIVISLTSDTFHSMGETCMNSIKRRLVCFKKSDEEGINQSVGKYSVGGGI